MRCFKKQKKKNHFVHNTLLCVCARMSIIHIGNNYYVLSLCAKKEKKIIKRTHSDYADTEEMYHSNCTCIVQGAEESVKNKKNTARKTKKIYKQPPVVY